MIGSNVTTADRQLLFMQYIWVDNSDICGDFLKSIFPTVKEILEDEAVHEDLDVRAPHNRMLCFIRQCDAQLLMPSVLLGYMP